jgi:hypothetical protein
MFLSLVVVLFVLFFRIKQGHGQYFYNNGDYFEGVYENGNRQRGVLRLANGSIFEGNFENDKKSGQGKMSWPSGDVYTGGFRENMRSGKGTVINLKRGTLFVGEYRNNRKHGVGYSIECGVAKREVWDNDELVSHSAILLRNFPFRDEDEQETLISTLPTAPEMQVLFRERFPLTSVFGFETSSSWVVVKVD